MSGLLIASNQDWKVPWANELIILKPVHPEGITNGDKKFSYATSVVTVYFGGRRYGATLDEEAKWQIGIVHRGRVEKESVLANLDLSNQSLFCAKPKKPQLRFFNNVLSQTPEKRRISAVNGKKPRVRVSLRDIVEPEQVFDAYKIEPKSVCVEYIELIDCTVISICGKGIKPRFFRVSYDHTASVLPIRRSTPTYTVDQYPGLAFPVEQDFEIWSYRKVLNAIKAQVHGGSEAAELFEEHIEERMITPAQKINLDLVVMGDPEAFQYEFMDSHLTTVDTLVHGVNWTRLNGKPGEPIRAVAYALFPKKTFHSAPEPFEMHVRARLSCNTCADYYLGSKLRQFEDKMQGLDEAVNKIQETGEALNALMEDVRELHKRLGGDQGNQKGT